MEGLAGVQGLQQVPAKHSFLYKVHELWCTKHAFWLVILVHLCAQSIQTLGD